VIKTQRFGVMGLVLLLLSGVATAGNPLEGGDAIGISLGVEYFSWREYSGERRLLEESGPRMFAELGMRKGLGASGFATLLGRLYLASVNYDGETTGGTSVPVVSNSIYGGWGLEGNYHLHLFELPAERSDLYFTVGVGYEEWLRSIQDGWAADLQSAVAGYLEIFRVPFMRVGFFYSHEGRALFQVGAKVPLQIREEVGFSRFYTEDTDKVRVDNFNVEPVPQSSLYASMRYLFSRHFGLYLYYDSYRMQASELVQVTANGAPVYVVREANSDVWKVDNGDSTRLLRAKQPESRQDTFGLLLSYYF
jgi:hypothetical protein